MAPDTLLLDSSARLRDRFEAVVDVDDVAVAVILLSIAVVVVVGNVNKRRIVSIGTFVFANVLINVFFQKKCLCNQLFNIDFKKYFQTFAIASSDALSRRASHNNLFFFRIY